MLHAAKSEVETHDQQQYQGNGALFGVDRFDPATYGSVAATIAGVALLASWLPAWRAGRIDPIRALRND